MNGTLDIANFIIDSAAGIVNSLKGKEGKELIGGLGRYKAHVTANINDKNPSNAQFTRSIRGQADKFILQYPLVASSSISLDTIETVRNQIELERAAEISIAISNSPIQDYRPEDDEFLGNLHTNLNLNESRISRIKNMAKLNEDSLVLEEDRLSSRSVNEYTIPRDYIMHLNEKDTSDAEAIKAANVKKQQEAEWEEKGYYRPLAKLTKSDVNKQNRSIPLMMTTTVNYNVFPRDRAGNELGEPKLVQVEVLFGLKSVLHTVDGEDVVFFLSDSARHSNLLTKLVKLSTGEISLVKDVMFRMDRAKRAAISSRNKNNIWRNLTTIADTDNARRYQKKQNALTMDSIIPTTTLLLSIDELDAIQRDTGRDMLTDSKFSDKVYRDLLLLDILVVDEPNSIIYKYDPRNKVFNRSSLSSLEGYRMSDSKKSAEMTPEEIVKMMKKRLRG